MPGTHSNGAIARDKIHDSFLARFMTHFWPFGNFFTGIRFDAFTAEKHGRKRALVHDCSGKSLKSSCSRSQNDHSSQDLSLYMSCLICYY